MRTTLMIDNDVLMVARGLADRDKKTIGEVLSELARKGLAPEPMPPLKYRNGVPLMPIAPGAGRATLELVKKLQDELD